MRHVLPWRSFLREETRTYSPNMLASVFGWNTDLPEWDGLCCSIACDGDVTVLAVQSPLGLRWINVAPEAMRKRTWAPIHRALNRKLEPGSPRSIERVREDLVGLTDAYTDYVRETCLQHARDFHRNRSADDVVERYLADWITLEGRLRIAPGKKLLGDICAFYKSECKVSLSPNALLDELREAELAVDLIEVLRRIDAFCTDEVSATLGAFH